MILLKFEQADYVLTRAIVQFRTSLAERGERCRLVEVHARVVVVDPRLQHQLVHAPRTAAIPIPAAHDGHRRVLVPPPAICGGRRPRSGRAVWERT